jgi:hypothetical protein
MQKATALRDAAVRARLGVTCSAARGEVAARGKAAETADAERR